MQYERDKMKIEIVERKNNPFLKREELKIKIEHLGEKTPEKAAFQIFLSKELGEHANKIDIRKILPDKKETDKKEHDEKKAESEAKGDEGNRKPEQLSHPEKSQESA